MLKIDMDMPECCDECDFCDNDGKCWMIGQLMLASEIYFRRSAYCPLTEDPSEKSCHNCKHEADFDNTYCNECEPVKCGTNWEWEESK